MPTPSAPSSGLLMDAIRALNEQRYQEAIAKFTQVAQGNDSTARAEAEYRLAVIFLPKNYRYTNQPRYYPDAPIDRANGMIWLNRAARDGNKFAMYMMGVSEREAGNIEAARRWLERARDAGMSEAGPALRDLR